jgi:hypothetical protein
MDVWKEMGKDGRRRSCSLQINSKGVGTGGLGGEKEAVEVVE